MIPKTPKELGPAFSKFKEWRPDQDTTLQNLLDSNRQYLMLEAPTGSGKTLVGIALHKLSKLQGTVYCPTTKKLQDQFMEDFGSFSIDLKGRLNYPCLQPGIENASQCIDGPDFDCQHRQECPYRLKVEDARHAELAVINIWALLCQINYASRFTNQTWREDEPHRYLLILDEADTLEDNLVGFASRQITHKYVKKNYLPIPDFEETDISYWLGWLEQALNTIEGYIHRAPLEEEKNKLRVTRNSLKFLFQNLSDSWVVELGKEEVDFIPTDISGLAQKYLFQHFDRILLMSASFCGNRIYTEVVGISLTDCDYFKVPSYFSPHKRPIYHIPCGKVIQGEEEWTLPEVAKAIDKILDTFPFEQTIIHTVSNSRADRLRQLSRHPMEVYTSTDGAANMQLFREGIIKTLISPSLDRGFDFPDDACRINIIVKVPYPYLGSESIKARMKSHRKWYDWQAVQKMVQMTGRSTRSQDDYSLSFILDSKFANPEDSNSLIYTGGKLFPEWWTQACKQITLEDVTPQLLEEAKK